MSFCAATGALHRRAGQGIARHRVVPSPGCWTGCVDAVGSPTESFRQTGMHHMSRIVMGIPRQGAMRGGAYPLTITQRAMVFCARWCFRSRCYKRVASLAARRSKAPRRWTQG